MARIKSKNTKPEILVRKFLFANKFRYRLHHKGLVGKPDIVLPKYKTVIFINGCFWHNHNDCKYASLPETNKEFWRNKIHGNAERDKSTYTKLESMGWRVIVIWQCQLKSSKRDSTLKNLIKDITNEQR